MASPRTNRRYLMKNGYIRIYVGRDDPYARSDGSVLEHRYVVMNRLGRTLTDQERVHHVNGNKTDNQPDNLVVMQDSDHAKHHHPTLDNRWSVRWDRCSSCQQTDQSHASHGLCHRCFSRIYSKRHPVTMLPSRRDRICVICRKLFDAWSANQRCCSHRCARFFFWREHPQHPPGQFSSDCR